MATIRIEPQVLSVRTINNITITTLDVGKEAIESNSAITKERIAMTSIYSLSSKDIK